MFQWLTGELEYTAGTVHEGIDWERINSGNVTSHKFKRVTQHQFEEHNQVAEWGDWYLSTSNDDDVRRPPAEREHLLQENTEHIIRQLTYQIGEDYTVRGNFANKTFLPNTVDTRFRNIDDDW